MFPASPEYRQPSPPSWWPQWQLSLFYKQEFRLQCFIYAKYTLHWPKRRIRKYLFIKAPNTYLKYSHRARAVIEEAYRNEPEENKIIKCNKKF